MSGADAFLWGLAGGALAEFLSIRRFQWMLLREWPESVRSWTFWLIAAGLVSAGGITAWAYSLSGFVLNPLLAMNVGLTLPFLGENGLDKLMPKPDLGPVN